jgi:hypothetical protein
MLDQMSMPVLFVVLFVVLGLAAGALFVAMRTVGLRARTPDKKAPVHPEAPGAVTAPK